MLGFFFLHAGVFGEIRFSSRCVHHTGFTVGTHKKSERAVNYHRVLYRYLRSLVTNFRYVPDLTRR